MQPALKRRLFFAIAFLVTATSGCVVGGGIGMGVGMLAGNRQIYRNIQKQKQHALQPLLADPRFGDLEIDHNLADDVWLSGNVQTRADFEALDAEVTRLFGEKEGEAIIAPVDIRDEPRFAR